MFNIKSGCGRKFRIEGKLNNPQKVDTLKEIGEV